MNAVDPVDQEIQQGNLWRAKEIHQGRVKQRGYDPQLYEAYGRLLADMGDHMEAGRFLFLSGAQVPEYREPVQLFLQRYGRHGWQQLVGTFPVAAKLPSLADYPESVRTELRRLGRPETLSPDATREVKEGGLGGSGLGCLFVLPLVLMILAGMCGR